MGEEPSVYRRVRQNLGSAPEGGQGSQGAQTQEVSIPQGEPGFKVCSLSSQHHISGLPTCCAGFEVDKKEKYMT